MSVVHILQRTKEQLSFSQNGSVDNFGTVALLEAKSLA
jgi:hypothetical protein